MERRMPREAISYVEHEDAIISLVSYLGAHEGRDGRDTATPTELAGYLDLDENEVRTVLDGFKGIFRKSQKPYNTREHGSQYRYTLHLRYARRKYVDGQIVERGEPLSNDDLFGLLNFITNRIVQEHENERHAKNARNTLVGVWVAGTMSLLAAALGLVGLLVK
jgi:hypothetical protein